MCVHAFACTNASESMLVIISLPLLKERAVHYICIFPCNSYYKDVVENQREGSSSLDYSDRACQSEHHADDSRDVEEEVGL